MGIKKVSERRAMTLFRRDSLSKRTMTLELKQVLKIQELIILDLLQQLVLVLKLILLQIKPARQGLRESGKRRSRSEKKWAFKQNKHRRPKQDLTRQRRKRFHL